ncbi:MAG TPA: type VI secretion system lipoprotein TssJ [Gammaproteobacteria bacterium]
MPLQQLRSTSVRQLLVRHIQRGLLLVVVVMLAACQSTFKEYVAQPVGKFFNWDTDVEVKFTVEPDTNPDDSNNNQPSPLVIRIYELAGKEKFENARFRDLYFDDKKTLADDFIKVHTLKPLLPGTTRLDKFKLKKGTAYVGLFAEFVQYKDADFRVVIPVDAYLTTTQDVRLSYHSLSLIRPQYWQE